MPRQGGRAGGQGALSTANVVALTGGIGSGKSTLGRLLQARGATFSQADSHARAVLDHDPGARMALRSRFGSAVFLPDDKIDRAGLAKIVFSDPDALAALESIVHPRVWETLVPEVLSAMEVAPLVVVELPLLAERGLPEPQPFPIDGVIVVEAPPEVTRLRLRARGMSDPDISARFSKQASSAQRRAIAGYIVDNAGELGSLEAQAEQVWQWATSKQRRTSPPWSSPFPKSGQ